MMNKVILFFLVSFSILACSPAKRLAGKSPTRLHFLGKYEIPHNLVFQKTTVGGLSGIDYDAATNLYYLICDDRSSKNPARFYTARIYVTSRGIDSVVFVSVSNLLQQNGLPFPNSEKDPFHTPDPEAIRYNPATGELVWSSEGERLIKKDSIVLHDPGIILMNTNGRYIDTFPLPGNMHMHATENGPRQNGVFEGMTFADNYRSLLVSVEEPIYEDGPRAGLNDSSAWIRIIKYEVASRRPVGQFGYKVDPVAFPPIPMGAFTINGIPDILAIDESRLLVIERSFSTGRPGCTIKVFEADLSAASDISRVPHLPGFSFHPVAKKLLLNMDDLGIYIDNVEGMTWGPVLPNGHKTLIFVADNNFSSDEITQFLLFEVE